MRTITKLIKKFAVIFVGLIVTVSGVVADETLWDLANKNAETFRFSTLFTAQDVRQYLQSDKGIDQAVAWCKETAVTHVYLESFRGAYTADRDVLLHAKEKFLNAGFKVSGCITTTKLGRDSVEGWSFPCFTDPKALETLQTAFEYAAGLFDEVMIDDFFATRCVCEDCVKARGDKSWDQFRCDLLVDISKKYVIDPARKVNPNVKLIIKYPQWYDDFHDKGYEVVRQSAMFDKIWVGTETREPDSKQWGRKTQYEAFYIMRWLGGIGGDKCGGGWFDPYGTKPPTYLEQARQTVLGGARQAVLFCYGSLLGDTGPDNVKALRKEIPQLFQLANLIQGKIIRGVSAPKIPNSNGGNERYVYDFIGMLGLPLVPTTEFSGNEKSVFLPVHTLKDEAFEMKIGGLIDKKAPVMVTDELAEKLSPALKKRLDENLIIQTPEDLWGLMDIPQAQLKSIRKTMLEPIGVEFDAPTRVALYLFGDDIVGVENFNDMPVEAVLKLQSVSNVSSALTIPPGRVTVSDSSSGVTLKLQPRSLVVLRVKK